MVFCGVNGALKSVFHVEDVYFGATSIVGESESLVLSNKLIKIKLIKICELGPLSQKPLKLFEPKKQFANL